MMDVVWKEQGESDKKVCGRIAMPTTHTIISRTDTGELLLVDDWVAVEKRDQ